MLRYPALATTGPPPSAPPLANDIKMISEQGFTPTCLELSETAVAQGRAAKIARATFVLGDVCSLQQTKATYDIVCKLTLMNVLTATRAFAACGAALYAGTGVDTRSAS